MSPTTPDERFELATLLGGEADDILLVHSETPISLVPTRVHGYDLLLNQTMTMD